MAFENGKIAYLVFHGYGFVSERIQTSTITNVSLVFGDIYDVEMLYTPTASIPAMEPQVGSRVVLDNYDAARNIPDGEYTIIAADDALTRVVIRGRFPVAPTIGPAILGRLRFEDFYKFCNSPPPAFVTGSEAQARWITNISQDGLSLTLGQKIDIIKAGFASVDGASVELVYNNNPIFSKLISFVIDTVRDTGSPSRTIATDRMAAGVTITGIAGGGVTPSTTGYRRTLPTDITIDFGNTSALPASILADSGVTFEDEPVWLNQEALIIYQDIPATNNSGDPVRRVDAIRGVLRTEPALHAPGTILINGLPGCEGQVVQILTINDNDLAYFQEVEEFYGVCENVVFENNQNSVILELSDISLTGFRQRFAAKITDRIVSNNLGNPDEVQSFTILSENNFIAESNAGGNWRWVKLGNACMRLENRTLDITDRSFGAYIEQITPIVDEFGTSVYETLYNFYPVFQGQTASGDIERYDDWYIVKHSTNAEDQGNYAYPKINGVTGDERVTRIVVSSLPNPENSYLIQSNPLDTSKQYTDNTFGASGTAAANVVCLDTTEGAPQQMNFELAHLFEQPDGSIAVEAENYAGGSFGSFGIVKQRFTPGFNEKCLPAGIICLQILTSGDGLVGGSPNGPFDVLPYNVGLGIPLERIDIESFGVYFNDALGVYVFNPKDERCRLKGANLWADTTFLNPVITIQDTENIASWMNKNILSPLAVGVASSNNPLTNQKTIRAFSFANIQPTDPETLDYINNNNTIQEQNIFKILGRSIDTSMETKGTDIVESVSYRYWRLIKEINRTTPTQVTIKAVPVEAIEDSDDIASYARLFTYIQSRPILEELKLYPAHNANKRLGEDRIARIGRQRVAQFSSVLPKLKFYTDIEESKTGTSKISVGDRISISNFTSVIDTRDGSRGTSGLGYCVAQKVDVLRGIIENEVVIVGPFNLQLSRWAASGEVVSAASTTVFDIDSTAYSGFDPEKFTVGDEILLFDENFILLSEDGIGNPQPQVIQSIVGNTITLVNPFTDSAGVAITPSATDIILLAEKSLQPIATQFSYAYQNDNESTWI